MNRYRELQQDAYAALKEFDDGVADKISRLRDEVVEAQEGGDEAEVERVRGELAQRVAFWRGLETLFGCLVAAEQRGAWRLAVETRDAIATLAREDFRRREGGKPDKRV